MIFLDKIEVLKDIFALKKYAMLVSLNKKK